MALNMGSAIAYLELDTSKFKSGFKSALDDLKVFTANGATATQKLNGLQSAFSTIGGGLTKGVTLPLVGIGTAAVKTATDFEKQMSEVKAISQTTGKEFEDLRNTAIELGGSTAFSASEVAQAMTDMAKAGWDSQQIIDGMSGVLDAAAASGEDLASVGEIVADAITTFGLSAEESTRVADLLTQSANAGTIGITDLAESYKYIGPLAKTMNFSIEDVTTAITALSTAGIKGSQAGTSLRGMLSRLVNPTEKVDAVMAELGIDLADSEGNFYSLDEILRQMRSTFKTMTPEQQAYYASVLAGQEGVSGLTALLGMNQEEYDKISDSMQNATGVAQETAKTMQDNLAGAVEQLGGALESAGIVIGDKLIPYIRQLAEFITGLIEKFNNLSKSQQDMIVKVGLIAAAVAPLMLVLSKVFAVTTSIIGIIAKVSSSFVQVKESIALVRAGFLGLALQMGGIPSIVSAIMSPFKAFKTIVSSINPVAVVIGVLVSAFKTLWDSNENFRNSIMKTWNEIKTNVSSAIDEIKGKFESYGIDFSGIIETLKSLWEGFCNIIAPLFTNGFEIVSQVISAFFSTISSVLDLIVGLLTGNIDLIMSGVSGLLTTLTTLVTGVASNIIQIIGQIASNILSALGFEQLSQTVSNFFNTLSMYVANLPTIITQLVQSFANIPSAVKSWLDKTINNVKTWATQLASNAKQAGSKFVNNVSNSIKQIPSKIKSQLDKAINSVKTWASNMASNAKSAGSKFINSVTSALKSLPSNIASVLSNVISKIASWASQLLNKGKQAASNLKNGIVNTAKQIPSQMLSIGTNIVNGVWQGIQNAKNAFMSKVSSFFSGIVNSVKSRLGIASPSKVFDKEIGQNIVKGVIQGVNKQKGNAKKSAKELSKLYVEAAEEKLSNMKEVNDISIKAEIIYWKKIKKELKKGTSAYSEATRKIKSLRKQLNEELKQLNEDFAQSVSETKQQLISDINDVTQAYSDAVKSRQEEITSSIGLFDKFESETENTSQSLIDNLKSQVEGLKEWDKALDVLRQRGVTGGLLEELEQMTPESLKDIQLLANMTDEQLSEYVKLWNEKQNIALTRSLKEIDKNEYLNQIKDLINEAGATIDGLEEQYKQDLKDLGLTVKDSSVSIGKDIVAGLKEGVTSEYPGMMAEVSNLVDSIVVSAKNTLGIHSPSTVFKDIGKNTVKGFDVGFTNEFDKTSKNVKSQIENLTNVNFVSNFKESLKPVIENYKSVLDELKQNLSQSYAVFSDALEDAMDRVLSRLETINDKMLLITDLWKQSGIDEIISYDLSNKNKNKTKQNNEGGQNNDNNNNGGDTFNFYNTKPEPYEYSRQMKKAKRELLQGT